MTRFLAGLFALALLLAPAAHAGLILNQLTGFGVKQKGGPATVTHTDNAVDPSFLSSGTADHTFSNASLGSASADRYILIGITSEQGSASPVTINSVSVAGNSATQKAQSATSGLRVEFWLVAVASGTTGDVVVNVTASATHTLGIGVWRLTNLLSTDVSDSGSDHNSGTRSVAITAAEGAVVIAANACNSDTRQTFTGVTEEFDVQQTTSSGSAGGSVSASSVTVTSVGGTSQLGVVAFR